MVNIQRHQEIDTQELSWIDLNQPEFLKLVALANEFCDTPGLGEKKSQFENELASMDLFDIYDLYATRNHMSSNHNFETTSLRTRQIEKALLSYIDEKWIDSSELMQIDLSVNQMDDIYKALKKEYSH